VAAAASISRLIRGNVAASLVSLCAVTRRLGKQASPYRYPRHYRVKRKSTAIVLFCAQRKRKCTRVALALGVARANHRIIVGDSCSIKWQQRICAACGGGAAPAAARMIINMLRRIAASIAAGAAHGALIGDRIMWHRRASHASMPHHGATNCRRRVSVGNQAKTVIKRIREKSARAARKVNKSQ